MREGTSEELEKKLREEGYQKDKYDPNRYDRPNTGETVWTDGNYSRTKEDSTYRENK